MESLVLDRFAGLNLPDDPEEVGFNGAVDVSNVDLDRKGRLRSRDGYAKLTALAGTNFYDTLYAVGSSLLAGAGTRLEEISIATGAVTTSSTAPTVPIFSFATIASSSTPAVYIANGTDQIRKWTSAGGFTAPAGLAAQAGRFLAVQTPDNRLVSAKGDRVSFSNPGTPETFGADDWVDVTPGDGESILALVSWNDKVFAFKQTKFAVFSGNSTDGTGGSIFNYRIVATGVGVSAVPQPVSTPIGGPQAVATPEGVFFGHSSGVYVTTGDRPVYVSQPLEPLYRQRVPEHYSGDVLTAPFSMVYQDRRVYCAHVDDTPIGTRIMVFDLDSRQWWQWDVPVGALASGIRNNAPCLFFAYNAGSKHIARFDASTSTDDGSAINWFYQSGFGDFGSPEIKTVRFTELWGTGAVTLKMATDQGTVDTGSLLTLGTAPAVDDARQSFARQGRFFSFRVSGSGAAVISRAVVYVRERRAVGLR